VVVVEPEPAGLFFDPVEFEKPDRGEKRRLERFALEKARENRRDVSRPVGLVDLRGNARVEISLGVDVIVSEPVGILSDVLEAE